MAKVVFNGFSKRFEIKEKDIRPAWTVDIKRWLLNDVAQTNWIKETTVLQLLNLYETIPLNSKGVIEALERRHIISWDNIVMAYEEYMNLRVNQAQKRIEPQTMEAFSNLFIFLLGRRGFEPFNSKIQEYISKKDETGLVNEFNRVIPYLNSSQNNLFIGPARKNRAIGSATDNGIDLPPEILSGRPYQGLGRAINIIEAYFAAIK